jgi:hypothetical protein
MSDNHQMTTMRVSKQECVAPPAQFAEITFGLKTHRAPFAYGASSGLNLQSFASKPRALSEPTLGTAVLGEFPLSTPPPLVQVLVLVLVLALVLVLVLLTLPPLHSDSDMTNFALANK